MKRWAIAAIVAPIALAVVAAPRVRAAGGKTYKVGDTVRSFVLKNEQGQQVKLSQYRGQVIVLNFYASW